MQATLQQHVKEVRQIYQFYAVSADRYAPVFRRVLSHCFEAGCTAKNVLSPSPVRITQCFSPEPS